MYFQELFSQGDLNEQELDVTLRTLGRRISSDSERRHVLIAVSEQFDLSDEVLNTFMVAAQQMNSDSEPRNVLIAYIKENPIDNTFAEVFVQTIDRMQSDTERRNVLLAFAERTDLIDQAKAARRR